MQKPKVQGHLALGGALAGQGVDRDVEQVEAVRHEADGDEWAPREEPPDDRTRRLDRRERCVVREGKRGRFGGQHGGHEAARVNDVGRDVVAGFVDHGGHINCLQLADC